MKLEASVQRLRGDVEQMNAATRIQEALWVGAYSLTQLGVPYIVCLYLGYRGGVASFDGYTWPIFRSPIWGVQFRMPRADVWNETSYAKDPKYPKWCIYGFLMGMLVTRFGVHVS